MNYPHLSDTQFPNINNVNVYRFRNTFDYTRWNDKTKITLCNVLWNGSYSDVVKWDSDEDRDAWFDSLTDTWVTELRTAARVVPEGYIKLPIPYDIMARYNYLFIDMPIATSATEPIDYETPNGIKRWYFFVEDIQYLSPNATQVSVQNDVWTNFQNKIDIPYMVLERGHAPVYASDTDTYLANPIENNQYLLAPDVNFDKVGVTKSSTFVPFGNGKKYVCFASTCIPSMLSELGSVSPSGTYTPSGNISYQNYNARYGYQLVVRGFGVGNGYDYSDANTPAAAGYSTGDIANNLTVYAIEANDVYGNDATYFDDVMKYCPQFFNTVKACFVVDEKCITLGIKYTWHGHDIYECWGKTQHLLTKALEKSEFNYPEELQRFAKLYTSPYSQLEITDNNGNSYEVNIEETSTLSVNSVVSVAFPYINERVYIEGIGGVGSKSYKWVDLKERTYDREMSNSDWFKYCFDWKIPTFALYMDGETSFMLESFNRNVKQAMQQSLVDYQNKVRSANTAYENVCDQADVAYTNTTARNATDNTNAKASHHAAYINVAGGRDSAGRTLKGITETNVENTRTDARCNSLQTTAMNNLSTYRGNQNAAHNLDMYRLQYKKAYDDKEADVYYANWLRQLTPLSNSITTVVNEAGNGALSIASGALSSGVPGGVAVGAVTAGVSLAMSLINIGSIQNLVDNYYDVKVANLARYLLDSTIGNDTTYAAQKRFIENIYTAENNLRTYNSGVDNGIVEDDGEDGRIMIKAKRLKSTEDANALNTRTVNDSNSDRTKNTNDANALRTRNNVKANAGYTRGIDVYNAQQILENGKYISMAAINDAKNRKPVELCSASGDPTPDYMQTRGVQIKVKTQSDSAIRQTGDIFARFGYMLNQIWNVADSGLKLMKHFTYWKASEIWVDDAEASNNSVNVFVRNMFLNGVTVWSDPTKIGRVNVYDN